MEFNWERFKIKNIAVECCNKEEMVDFLGLVENNGIDGILTIMDEKGFVYSFNGKEKKQIAVSFSNFLKELI